ncbi:MAG: hypothetical protein ACRBFS_16515 [Aureispira sp.]
MEELLDDQNNSPTILTLSNTQLIGLLQHKTRLSTDFANTLNKEIARRKLSANQIQQLVKNNTSSEILSNPILFDFYQLRMLIVAIFLFLFIAHFSLFFVGIILLTVSTRAIRRYWMIHPNAAQTTWKRFEYALLMLTLLVYLSILFF